MCNLINLIKVFDENVAIALSDCGFSYMKEKFNGTQEVYVFESSDELLEVLAKVCSAEKYSGTIIVTDNLLNF